LEGEKEAILIFEGNTAAAFA